MCNCSQGGQIAYGDPKWMSNGNIVNTRLVIKNSARLPCVNQFFGDPISGIRKACWCKKSGSGTEPTLPNKPDPTTSGKVEGAALACVKPKSVGQCGKCQSKDQCKTGYCCPFMKKCVNSGRD